MDRLRPDRPTYPHGVIVTEVGHPGSPPPIVPYDASYRAIGGVRVPSGMLVPVPPGEGTGHSIDIYGYRQMGERHGDGIGRINSWDRGSHHSVGHSNVFVPQHPIMDPEEELLDPSHEGADTVENDCTLVCLSTEFLCSRSCACTPKFTRCDGDLNCEDGEDEEDCNATNEEIIKGIRAECESTGKHVMCPRTFKCIAEEWLCDGDDDCGDYSDETKCGAHVNCSEDQFECLNGLCIQQTWVCDGDNDCKDFSDEMNCTKLS